MAIKSNLFILLLMTLSIGFVAFAQPFQKLLFEEPKEYAEVEIIGFTDFVISEKIDIYLGAQTLKKNQQNFVFEGFFGSRVKANNQFERIESKLAKTLSPDEVMLSERVLYQDGITRRMVGSNMYFNHKESIIKSADPFSLVEPKFSFTGVGFEWKQAENIFVANTIKMRIIHDQTATNTLSVF